MNEITVKTNSGTLILEVSEWKKYGKHRLYLNSKFGNLVWDVIAKNFISCKNEINNPYIREQVSGKVS